MQDIGTRESFIVFGCWNKYTDIDGDLPVKKVTDKIKGFLQKEDNNPKLSAFFSTIYAITNRNAIYTKNVNIISCNSNMFIFLKVYIT